eukprot:TRINITY_DN6617_c0_g1_i1.p1 TRINITY_DN6617_c0_g1~~TRINITY_DN6617_c0_g1_i1.p1  ORF type:complete len:180 (+),score=32.02 TRINITY_DN6617_c0_g1_i1:47-541(+)
MAAIAPLTGFWSVDRCNGKESVLLGQLVSKVVKAASENATGGVDLAGWNGVGLTGGLMRQFTRACAAGSCSAKLTVDGETKEFDTTNTSHKIHPFCEEQGIQFSCIEGTCGTCSVDVNKGAAQLNGLTEQEIAFFGGAESAGNKRLACQVQIKRGATGDIEVEK